MELVKTPYVVTAIAVVAALFFVYALFRSEKITGAKSVGDKIVAYIGLISALFVAAIFARAGGLLG